VGNRYQPPRTRVADAGAKIRPRSINAALVLVGLLVLVECYHQVMNLSEVGNGEMSGVAWIADWIWVAAIIVAGFFIARGRDWARWVFGIITLHVIYEYLDARLFIASFGEGVEEFVAPFSLWILPMSSLFAVAAIILVFGPGRAWFERVDG
jgi:hypothetical protein